MTLTRSSTEGTFVVGTMYDKEGNIIREQMFKYEARLMLLGMLETDAVECGFLWVENGNAENDLTWHKVHEGEH